jgi:hypothetical protein
MKRTVKAFSLFDSSQYFSSNRLSSTSITNNLTGAIGSAFLTFAFLIFVSGLQKICFQKELVKKSTICFCKMLEKSLKNTRSSSKKTRTPITTHIVKSAFFYFNIKKFVKY